MLPTRNSLIESLRQTEITLQKLAYGIDTFSDDDAIKARRSVLTALAHIEEARFTLQAIKE